MPSPIYAESAPPPGLEALVLDAWRFEVPETLPGMLHHEAPPDGCTSLVWTRHDVVVVGPRLEPLHVHLPAGSLVQGLRLWPDAAVAVLGVPGEALRGVTAPVSVIAPDLQIEVGAPLRLVPVAPGALDPLVRRVVRGVVASGGTASLGQLAVLAGRSGRQVQRRFRHAVGLTIKEFSRIRRVREAAGQVLGETSRRWGEVAYAAGYADQAHLAREFTALLGRSPEAFRRWTQRLEHRDVRP